MNALQQSIQAKVPFSMPSPFSKHWWSKELHAKKKEVAALGHCALPYKWDCSHPLQKEFRTARMQYGVMIEHAKRDCWRA